MIKVKTFYVIDLEKSVTQAMANITNGLLDESGVITTFEPTEVKTLLGENNIYSNCGDVEVTYYTYKSNDILEFIDSEIGKKNGTNIPIEGNSQDSIKDYIDTGLSGKADTIFDSDWIPLPLASGISNYGDLVSRYRKIGNVIYYYVLVEKSGLSWGTLVATFPTNYRPSSEATSSGRYGNGICNFSIATDGKLLFLASTNTSTTDYRFFACGSFYI